TSNGLKAKQGNNNSRILNAKREVTKFESGEKHFKDRLVSFLKLIADKLGHAIDGSSIHTGAISAAASTTARGGTTPSTAGTNHAGSAAQKSPPGGAPSGPIKADATDQAQAEAQDSAISRQTQVAEAAQRFGQQRVLEQKAGARKEELLKTGEEKA